MKKLPIIIVFVLHTLMSCNDSTQQDYPNINFEIVNADFNKWWPYHNMNVVLSSNFIAVDQNNKQIDKEMFLQALMTGNYIPLKLITSDITKYKLYKLNASTDKEIGNTIRSISTSAYNQFKMEGTEFSEFYFTDLNGKTYNKEEIKGKIVFLKCWFIKCKPCIAEFPKLNEFVDTFNNRNDVLFISLALDSKEDLKEFLSNNEFKYVTIPNQKDFIQKKLKVNMFPTHFLIDRDGVIKKMVTNLEELLLEINTTGIMDETFDDNLDIIPPPPPPIN